MSDQNLEGIIDSLYGIVQDAHGVPLSGDKCIIERERVLDMLDEIIAQLPGELKQARTIVESRNELISQARREAETIRRQAHEEARQMVTHEAVFAEAQQRAQDMINQAQNKVNQLKKAGNDYMDDALRRTEETIAQALGEVRDTRMKFRTVTEAQEQRRNAAVKANEK